MVLKMTQSDCYSYLLTPSLSLQTPKSRKVWFSLGNSMVLRWLRVLFGGPLGGAEGFKARNIWFYERFTHGLKMTQIKCAKWLFSEPERL